MSGLRERVARALFERRADLGDTFMGTWEEPAWSLVAALTGKDGKTQQQEVRDFFLADADAAIALCTSDAFRTAALIVERSIFTDPTLAIIELRTLADVAERGHQGSAPSSTHPTAQATPTASPAIDARRSDREVGK